MLVLVVVAEDAVDELIALVVVEEADVALVFGNEALEELEALDDGTVAVAEVGLHKLLVVEPPELGVPFGQEVVGIGGFAIVFGNAGNTKSKRVGSYSMLSSSGSSKRQI